MITRKLIKLKFTPFQIYNNFSLKGYYRSRYFLSRANKTLQLENFSSQNQQPLLDDEPF